MKQGENEAKHSWEPMQLRCVGRIGKVVEAAGKQPLQDVDLDLKLTPPDDQDN